VHGVAPVCELLPAQLPKQLALQLRVCSKKPAPHQLEQVAVSAHAVHAAAELPVQAVEPGCVLTPLHPP
jgi:hypothetical protein